ncbi:sigma-70 family RNA polymerase sigma factor [Georgenia sp. 311]|uniref:sigma-70 family RNA polymerase sigma factor n=1 Tax=Georgenia sp. 311 TaxID=2585134 RepID=UPI001111B809|nr:sigma-70 family RNA polymerase sigma factor [Georgenia sp. 311]TNC17602.1 sigma-70 family RNA polymerase sigma factor [Georgenia sp. 311]
MALARHEQDELIQQHLSLVGYHVSEMIRRVPAHVQRDELAAAGSLALVQAARAFDAELGVPFGRYASTRIRGAILDELRGMDWASRGTRQRARRLGELTERLTAELGRAPRPEELADAMGVGVEEVRSIRDDAQRRIVSLDADTTTGAATLADQSLSPEQRVVVAERLRYLTAGVTELPDKLRVVVEGIFFQERPVVEIAEELGVTQSRISQLRTQALGMLRDAMNTALDPELVAVTPEVPGVAEKRRQMYYAAVAQRASTSAMHAAAVELAVPAVVSEAV